MREHESDLKTFLDISVHLTGFNEVELQGTGMTDIYYNTVVSNSDPQTTQLFLNEAAEIMSRNKGNPKGLEADIANKLMPDNAFNGLAKNIIMMWYIGNWGDKVISPNAYQQGLVWEAAETHPPGAKQPGYGSWAEAPINVNTKA